MRKQAPKQMASAALGPLLTNGPRARGRRSEMNKIKWYVAFLVNRDLKLKENVT
jgi:hypothetical protein